jgi:hypothetical protein
MLGDGSHAITSDVSGETVLLGTESVTPNADNIAIQPCIDELLEPWVANGEELCAMVEDGLADATCCEATTNSSSLVEDDNRVTRSPQLIGRNEAGETRANDGDIHAVAKLRR